LETGRISSKAEATNCSRAWGPYRFAHDLKAHVHRGIEEARAFDGLVAEAVSFPYDGKDGEARFGVCEDDPFDAAGESFHDEGVFYSTKVAYFLQKKEAFRGL